MTLNSLGEPEERAAYRDALVAFYRATPRRARRGFAAPAGDQPAAHPRLEEPDDRGAQSRTRRCSSRPERRSQARFATVRELLDALGVATRSTRAWCAASTTTRRRSSRSRRPPASSARRTPSAAAAATTAWSSRWAARRRRPSASRLGVERDAAGAARDRRDYERPVNVFFAPHGRGRARLRAAAGPPPARGRHRRRVEHRGGSLKSQLKRADKLRARLAVIIGENEVESGNSPSRTCRRARSRRSPRASSRPRSGRRWTEADGARGAGVGGGRDAGGHRGLRLIDRRRLDGETAATQSTRRPADGAATRRRFRARCSMASTSPAGIATSASRHPAPPRWESTTTRKASIRSSRSTASRRSGSAARSGAR